jgi:hypothetical protein
LVLHLLAISPRSTQTRSHLFARKCAEHPRTFLMSSYPAIVSQSMLSVTFSSRVYTTIPFAFSFLTKLLISLLGCLCGDRERRVRPVSHNHWLTEPALSPHSTLLYRPEKDAVSEEGVLQGAVYWHPQLDRPENQLAMKRLHTHQPYLQQPRTSCANCLQT